MLVQERQHVRDVLSRKIKDFSQKQIEDLEIGIYNWSIQFADKNDIIKNWLNERYKNVYLSKAISVCANLSPDSYVKNHGLLERVKDKQFKPHDIPFMKPDQMFPEKWIDIMNIKQKKEDSIFEDNLKPMTDQFVCGKCKSRECVYREVQIRSCDEPMTLFIKCIQCGHKWRMG